MKPGNVDKRTWLKWFVPVFTALVMLLLAEFGLRAASFAMNKVRGSTYDPELGWRLVAGITKKDYQWCDQLPATTNSAGWRDAEHTLEKPNGVTRIVALGDSFTFGYGVDFGQRFTEFLEESMSRAEVINMGVFAYGTDQEVRVYELYGRQYKPDIVILNVYLGNDIDDLRMKVIHSWPKPYFVPESDGLRLVKPEQAWSIFIRTHSYLAELLLQLLERGKRFSSMADELRDADMVKLFYALVGRLSAETTADNAKLLVVLYYPRDATAEEQALYKNISRELSAQGHAVLDLHSVFNGLTAMTSALYLEDGHLSPAGHRLAAEMIRKEFVGRRWVSQ